MFSRGLPCVWAAVGLLLAAGGVSALPVEPERPGPAASPGAAARRGKVVHLQIKGDLDSMKLVREFSAELASADQSGIALLLIELDGNRWRADVVWGLVQAARAVGAPTAAWLADPKDNRVGTGQALVAVLASTAGAECWLAPKTAIVLDPGDDLRAQAPEETDWERVDRELSGAAWTALKARNADTELAATLLTPGAAGPVWVVVPTDDTPPRLTGERPVGDAARQARRLVSVMPGASGAAAADSAHVEIPADLALRLPIAAGTARGPGEILTRHGSAAQPRVSRSIQSGLGAARRQVEQDATKIDRALESADQRLRDLPRPSDPDYTIRKRRAGNDTLPLLNDAQVALEQCERIIAEYPELLKATAPGRTPVGEDPKLAKMSWRLSFQARRDTLVKLLAKAREFAGP